MRQHAQAFREQQVCYLCVLHRHPSMCPHPHRYCTRVGVCACVFASFLAELLTRKCAAHCAQAAWSWRSGQENRGASTPWFTLSPSLVRHMLQTGMQLPHCHCILLPAVDTCACRGAPPAPWAHHQIRKHHTRERNLRKPPCVWDRGFVRRASRAEPCPG